MRKILVVEDNDTKRDVIIEIIDANFETEIVKASSIVQVFPIVNVLSKEIDLIILDMTFQISTGMGKATRKEPLAGVELLQYMYSMEILIPVIVVTQHSEFVGGAFNIKSVDELDQMMADGFGEIYHGIIRADLATDEWHNEFVSRIAEVFDVSPS